jgi:hypothetical protein
MVPPAMQTTYSIFDLAVVEPLATKQSFQMQEHMKITWR